MSCPFRLSVINDEISADFDHACSVAANDFGLQWIELRSMWNKNVTDLNADEVDKSRQILEKYKLRVTDIASPLFKVDWPGAPKSKEGPNAATSFTLTSTLSSQDEVLARCIELCKAFQTDRIRCFDFWRLDDQKPYRAAINDKLRQAARTCAEHKLILLLENEMACNTATGPEAADCSSAIREPNFMLNWDPGNSATFAGDVPYPDDYNHLPKHRIGHCHCKDTVRTPTAIGNGRRSAEASLTGWASSRPLCMTAITTLSALKPTGMAVSPSQAATWAYLKPLHASV